ncbi:hypothetical protein DFJ77DRAFT_468989 [Powellomyces hirtus]|nr:hypothetical protein DFJ77DRAFT_468989 [Powellomyces hirtus]
MPANNSHQEHQDRWSNNQSYNSNQNMNPNPGGDRQQTSHMHTQQQQQHQQPHMQQQQQPHLQQQFPPAVNSLQAMLQQLQQQQQQQQLSQRQTPLGGGPAQQSAFAQQSQTPLGTGVNSLPFAQNLQQPNPLLNQALPFGGSSIPTAMPGLQPAQGAAVAPAFNMQSLTPLQQAQLQQLQQLQQQQQQQQLARILAALMPNAMTGVTALNPLATPAGGLLGVGLPTPSQLHVPSGPVPSDPRANARESSAAQDTRSGRGDSRIDDYRDRRRDYSTDSRDRKGRRDRSRSPDRHGSRRSDRRRSYRSDSDSEDDYRRNGSGSGRRGSRDRGGREASPQYRRSAGGQYQSAETIPDGPLKTRHLWIGDMPPDATEHDIRHVFSRHGPISEIKMLPLKKGKTSAFLAYSTKANATKCKNSENIVCGVNAVIRLNSRYIGVPDPDEPEGRPDGRYGSQGGYHREHHGSRGFVQVKGLRYGVSRDDLVHEFQKFGRVLDVRKKVDSDQAVVEFESSIDAGKAANTIRGTDIWGPGVTIQVSNFAGGDSSSRSTVQIVERSSPVPTTYGQPSRGGPPHDSRAPVSRGPPFPRRGQNETASLYLPMVPSTLNQDELERVCAPFGAIETVRIIPGKYSQHSMAFVNYREVDAAKRAYSELSGKYLFGSPEPLKVEFAQSSGTRRRETPLSAPPTMGVSTSGGTFSHRTLVLNNSRQSSDGAPATTKQPTPAPGSPAVVIKNFSHRLSGREIAENLHKLLAPKFSKSEINLFNVQSLEDCFAAVTGLAGWEADAIVRDLENLEFFGSPLTVAVSTYEQAVTKAPELPNAVTPRNVSTDALLDVIPEIAYKTLPDVAAWDAEPYPVIAVQNLQSNIKEQDVVAEVSDLPGGPAVAATITTDESSSTSAFLLYPTKVDARKAFMNGAIAFGGSKPVPTMPATFTSTLIRIATATSQSTDRIPPNELTRVFSRYGSIADQLHTQEQSSSVQDIQNIQNGDRNGYRDMVDIAYIRYDTLDHAVRAVGAMNGEVVGGFRDELQVTFFDPRVLKPVQRNGHHEDESEEDEDEMEILEEFVVPQSTAARQDPAQKAPDAAAAVKPVEPSKIEEPVTFNEPKVEEHVTLNEPEVEKPVTFEEVVKVGEPMKVDTDLKVDPPQQSEGTDMEGVETYGVEEHVEEKDDRWPDHPYRHPSPKQEEAMQIDYPVCDKSVTFTTLMALKSKLTQISIQPLAGTTSLFDAYFPESLSQPLKLSQRFQTTPDSLRELAQKCQPSTTNWVLALCTPIDPASPDHPTVAKAAPKSIEQFMAIDRYFRDRAAAGMAVIQSRAFLRGETTDASPASVSIVPLSDATRAPFAQFVDVDAQGLLMVVISPMSPHA